MLHTQLSHDLQIPGPRSNLMPDALSPFGSETPRWVFEVKVFWGDLFQGLQRPWVKWMKRWWNYSFNFFRKLFRMTEGQNLETHHLEITWMLGFWSRFLCVFVTSKVFPLCHQTDESMRRSSPVGQMEAEPPRRWNWEMIERYRKNFQIVFERRAVNIHKVVCTYRIAFLKSRFILRIQNPQRNLWNLT